MQNNHFKKAANPVTPARMNLNLMWATISFAHERGGEDMAKKSYFIHDEILRLSQNDAVSFNRSFELELVRSYTWTLADAASLIIGPVGEDPEGEMRFLCFRVALMSMGMFTYDTVLDMPEIIADLDYPKEMWEYKQYWPAVVSAILKKGGYYETYNGPKSRHGETLGARVKERFPTLVNLYP